jgi:hypothetical protein
MIVFTFLWRVMRSRMITRNRNSSSFRVIFDSSWGTSTISVRHATRQVGTSITTMSQKKNPDAFRRRGQRKHSWRVLIYSTPL